jgi:hypothetical protein
MNVLHFILSSILFFVLLPSYAFLNKNGMNAITGLGMQVNTYVIENDLKSQVKIGNDGKELNPIKTEENSEDTSKRLKEDRLDWLLWGLLPVAIALIFIAYRNYKLKKKY